jgi:hypothetical protein
MVSEIPVLVCHFGENEYVRNNLKISSKNNKIVFIGDKKENTKGIDNVDFIDVRNFMKSDEINNFKDYFKPYNTTDPYFVWLWYLRVFILSEYVFQTNSNSIFHIDSDNVLLSNINNYNFQKEIAYCIPPNNDPSYMSGSIHSGLLNKKFFKMFEEFYVDIFINKSKFHLIESKIKYHENFGNGGICDMTIFYLIYVQNKKDIQNLLSINTDKNTEGVVFMNDLNDLEGLESKKQFKKDRKNKIQIFNFDNQFYIYDIPRQCHVKIMNIHFQGKAKSLLSSNTFLETLKDV